MKVKIWGARGSIPTPTPSADIREKIAAVLLNVARLDLSFQDELIAALTSSAQSEAERREVINTYLNQFSSLQVGTASGNTPCIEVRVNDELFIIDAGSGIRELGVELMKGPCGEGKGVIHLLFSHPHWDHIQGFPFFRPAFVPGNKIHIYGVHNMESVLRQQQNYTNFPVSIDYMQADFMFVPLEPNQVLDFEDLRIRNIRNQHPGDAYSFRFEIASKVFVYASDAGYPPGTDLRPYINFFADADLLIYDAQFTQRESDEKEDWGHSSSFVGVEMAQEAQVKTLLLYHFDPTYSDAVLEKILEDTLKFQRNQYPNRKPVDIQISCEGQTFDLTPPRATELQQVPGTKATILKPNGIFTELVAQELKEYLRQTKQKDVTPRLIIDMTDVEMLQVTGLRSLVKLRKEEPGAAIVLAGPNINVQQLIELAGYSDFFATYSSVETALHALDRRETLNLPGQMIKGRYYIESKVGDGRLGVVFRAMDTRHNQAVAIKILSPSFSEAAMTQFLQQGRQIIDLHHTNIVNVYDCDQEQGLSFMVEEFIEARTLQDILNDRPHEPFPLDIALAIAEAIIRGLEYAHARGVVHGDLKPKNVLLDKDAVKISDFGLGRLESGRSLLNIDVPLSAHSAQYLAPEQLVGHPIDARTDLYALGVILYQMFTGYLPFLDESNGLEPSRRTTPRPPTELNPNLSHSLAHLILKLLDKDAEKRYDSAHQLRRIFASLVTISNHAQQGYSFARQQWPPLVGQTRPLQLLMELWQQTIDGHGQLAFISGEAGIGKTHLVQELGRRVGMATLLMGSGRPVDIKGPYHPFVEAVRHYWAEVTNNSRTDAPDVVRPLMNSLAQLVPGLARILPDVEQPDPDATPNKTGGLVQAIQRATEMRPVLLILDDLHLTDPATLRLLHYLAQHCTNTRLMIVGVYQTESTRRHQPLQNLFTELAHGPGFTQINLDPLNKTEVRQLLQEVWSQKVPVDLVASIYRRTGGNPLHVAGIALGLLGEEVVTWHDGAWHFAPVVEAGLPHDAHEAIMWRLNHLSRETQTLLRQAAVLGLNFSFDDLHEMSDLSEWDALESLDIALERQLIHEASNQKVYSFSHPEVQRALYDSLSPLKRQLMHREAAEALERRYQADHAPVVEALAYHYFHANELEKALIFSIQMARQSEALYAYRNALAGYTQALSILDHLDPERTTQQQRLELILARERIYAYLGEVKPRVADLNILHQLAEASDDASRQAMVHYRWAAYYRQIYQFDNATREAIAGREAAQHAHNPALQGEYLLQHAMISLQQGQLRTAADQFSDAQDIFNQPPPNRTNLAACQIGLGLIYRLQHDLNTAAQALEQSLQLYRGLVYWSGYALALNYRALLARQRGNYTEAIMSLTQAREISRLVGCGRTEAECVYNLADIHRELGQYNVTQDYLARLTKLHHALADRMGRARELRLWGLLYLVKKEYREARTRLTEAVKIFAELGTHIEESQAMLELGLAWEASDESIKALEAYRKVLAIQKKGQFDTGLIDATAGIARSHLAQGDISTAQNELAPWLTASGVAQAWYPIRFYLTVYYVMQATGQINEAQSALHTGHTLLQSRLQHLAADTHQTTFLNDVPEHQALIALLNESPDL